MNGKLDGLLRGLEHLAARGLEAGGHEFDARRVRSVLHLHEQRPPLHGGRGRTIAGERERERSDSAQDTTRA